jgi:hypothetical protein
LSSVNDILCLVPKIFWQQNKYLPLTGGHRRDAGEPPRLSAQPIAANSFSHSLVSFFDALPSSSSA